MPALWQAISAFTEGTPGVVLQPVLPTGGIRQAQGRGV